ncbi:MAG: hypothetical protein Q8R91_04425 [Candidatus Omnitrophota bacterium]|nr:hypothetical protein [Candidatus Omnitrophota bacterium]
MNNRPLVRAIAMAIMAANGGGLLLWQRVGECRPAPDGQPLVITVHAGSVMGKLPFLFRSGMFAYGAERVYPEYLQEKFLRDHRPGAIEFGLNHVIVWSESPADLVRRLRSQPRYDAFLKRIVQHGGTVVLSLFGMPRWLSSRPDDARPVEPGEWMPVWAASPPADYDAWAELVRSIVDYYSHELGLRQVEYKVWWEPEYVRWQGTEEELFKLYQSSVQGAKKADPQAAVGGPSVAGWSSIFWKHRDRAGHRPMLYNFIESAATYALSEPGHGSTPIDVLIWHDFGLVHRIINSHRVLTC